MPAAPDGQVIVTVPRADGTTVTVTLNFDPASRLFAPRALLLDGTGGASVHVRHAAGGTAEFSIAEGGHIGAGELAAAGIKDADSLHGFTVTAH